jgi:hypothetical protein
MNIHIEAIKRKTVEGDYVIVRSDTFYRVFIFYLGFHYLDRFRNISYPEIHVLSGSVF